LHQKKILVAPLNWGLGHATRCIPIIEELLHQGAEVILASDGEAYQLLKREFPNLEIHLLPAYNIHYPPSTRGSMVLSMAYQMPKILRGALMEHFWLKNFLKNTPVGAVIADNRYGFFSRKTRSVFMTHQVNILMPFPFFQTLVNAVNHFFIKKFDVCWIPDFEFEPNLAGVLSHGHFPKNLKIKYLGILSRFAKKDSHKVGEVSNLPDLTAKSPKYRAAIILSGPEPQRSILEEKIRLQLALVTTELAPFLLIRGTLKPYNANEPIPNLEIHDLLTSGILKQKMSESAVVICRSGYSSIMDLVALQKPAILIPTTGQTEQEYLATELMRQNQFFSISQDQFDLMSSLNAYQKFNNFINCDVENKTLKEIISELWEF
jgi:UDP-N-acetylglucosamine transferase subunit ALG13